MLRKYAHDDSPVVEVVARDDLERAGADLDDHMPFDDGGDGPWRAATGARHGPWDRERSSRQTGAPGVVRDDTHGLVAEDGLGPVR